jgi:hypothetical protein
MILNAAWDGPLQRLGPESRRKVPLNFGWLARVSGINPINVPVFLELEVQSNPQSLPRLNGGPLRYKVNASMGAGGAYKASGERQQKKGPQAWRRD